MAESSHELAIQGALIPPEQNPSVIAPTNQEQIEPFFDTKYARIFDKYRDRKLMREIPLSRNFLVVDFKKPDQGVVINHLNPQKIEGDITLDYPADNLFAAVFIEGTPDSAEVLSQTLLKIGKILASEKPNRRKGVFEKSGVIFGSVPKEEILDDLTILEALAEAGLVEATVLKGTSSHDPYRFEARKKEKPTIQEQKLKR